MIKETESKNQRMLFKKMKDLESQSKREANKRKKEQTELSFSGSFKFAPYIPPRRQIKSNRLNPLDSKDLNLESKNKYDDEDLIIREKLAQEEIERKKLQVAPLYNKGAYQYITSTELLHDIGKKK